MRQDQCVDEALSDKEDEHAEPGELRVASLGTVVQSSHGGEAWSVDEAAKTTTAKRA